MWKLFPNSWPERAGIFKDRLVQEAQALEKHWLQWLEAGLWRVNPRISGSGNPDAVKALLMLSGRGLLCLDEMLRVNSLHHSARPLPCPRASGESNSDREVAEAYLFVAACSPSGFIRERALDAFAHFPGPLAFAAGLIRSTDWVAQVRTAANALVRSVAPQLSSTQMTRFLELAARLKDRVRVDVTLWQTYIEPRLKASESRDALWSAARDPGNSSLQRRLAFEYLVLGKPADLARILNQALMDPDIQVGLWALEEIKGISRAEERAQLLQFALSAGHAAVRRAALRQYTTLEAGDCDQRLRTALFDTARSVRALAAFELMRTGNEAPLPLWRAAVNHPQRGVSEVAIIALCETGEREDVEKVAPLALAGKAVVRASVLRGLWRVGSDDLESRLTSALKDCSTRVIRQAAEIYRKGTVTLDALVLENALAGVPSSRAPYLIAMSDSLGRWEALEFLLHHALDENSGCAEYAADRIDRWILSVNRRFTAPSALQIQRLIRLSRDAQTRHSQRDWNALGSILASFA